MMQSDIISPEPSIALVVLTSFVSRLLRVKLNMHGLY